MWEREAMNGADLQDLVDNPRETLEIEVKGWLDLSNGEVRANLARHICALANHGGGYLIFGFSNTLDPQPTPTEITAYNRDTFSSIVKRYLQPTVDCEVQLIASVDGSRRHAVVWVPGVVTAPLCAKADGPQDEKGRVQGIKIGCHYVRDTGPASVPITNPDQWRPVVRRCVLNDRERLLETVQNIFREPPQGGTEPNAEKALKEWHQKSHERFLSLIPRDSKPGVPATYRACHFQFSYAVTHDATEALPPSGLMSLVGALNHEVRDLVWTGWSMFYPFTRDAIRPYFLAEQLSQGDVSVLEANLMADPSPVAGFPDFWRVASNGMATLIRSYFEDEPRATGPGTDGQPVPFLSPRYTACLLGELVRHAHALASRFETAAAVSFLCTWRGLSGRRIADMDWGVYWGNRGICRQDERTVIKRWPLSALAEEWLPEVVAEILSTVTVLFDGLEIAPKTVAEWSKSWRQR
jgi:hypothetical protein